MEHFNYKPTGVCSRNIEIELDGNRIEKVAFTGGCSGNTQGIAARSSEWISTTPSLACPEFGAVSSRPPALISWRGRSCASSPTGSRVKEKTAGDLRVV